MIIEWKRSSASGATETFGVAITSEGPLSDSRLRSDGDLLRPRAGSGVGARRSDLLFFPRGHGKQSLLGQGARSVRSCALLAGLRLLLSHASIPLGPRSSVLSAVRTFPYSVPGRRSFDRQDAAGGGSSPANRSAGTKKRGVLSGGADVEPERQLGVSGRPYGGNLFFGGDVPDHGRSPC
jgi:hypothetical protein